MKAYVSGHDRAEAKAVADAIRNEGVQVISDWHDDTVSVPRNDTEWSARANVNLVRAAVAADVLVLIAGADRCPGGKFVEAGAALILGTAVVVVGRIENNMLRHRNVVAVPGVPELIEYLKRIE